MLSRRRWRNRGSRQCGVWMAIGHSAVDSERPARMVTGDQPSAGYCWP